MFKALLTPQKPAPNKDEQRGLKEVPIDYSNSQYAIIQSLISKNEHTLALKLIDEYLTIYPNSYRYKILQFETYYAIEEFTKALRLIESLLTQNDDLDLMKRIQKLYYKMIKTNIKINQGLKTSVERNIDDEAVKNATLLLQKQQNRYYFSQILYYEEKQMQIQSHHKYSLFFLSVVKELQIDQFSTKYPDVEIELIKMGLFTLEYPFFDNIDRFGNDLQWLSKAHSIIKKHIPNINPITVTKSTSIESFDIDLDLYQSSKYILFDLKLQELLLKKSTTKE